MPPLFPCLRRACLFIFLALWRFAPLPAEPAPAPADEEFLLLAEKLDVYVERKNLAKILEITGDRVKLGINAPRDVVILRQELQDEVRQENLRAVRPGNDVGSLLGAAGDALARRRAPSTTNNEKV